MKLLDAQGERYTLRGTNMAVVSLTFLLAFAPLSSAAIVLLVQSFYTLF